MGSDKEDKIEKYHFEEIVFILLILATDLSKYEGETDSFGESIEGRIEVLFTRNFLTSLDKKYGVTDEIGKSLEMLKSMVVSLYEPNWTRKLFEPNKGVDEIRVKASQVLGVLKIDIIDPLKFLDDHLIVDW